MTLPFHEHLARQLDFLRRSSQSFDIGYQDEALRIAVVLRVLFHNTKNSTSLLKHLGATTISLLSTAWIPPVNVPMPQVLRTMVTTRITPEGIAIRPQLGDNPAGHKLMPFSKWWDQVVFVDYQNKLTRRTAVLGAANKDGGAHVDAKLDPDYEQLTKDGAFFTAYVTSASGSNYISESKNAHFALLRQIAFETLASSELLCLLAENSVGVSSNNP